MRHEMIWKWCTALIALALEFLLTCQVAISQLRNSLSLLVLPIHSPSMESALLPQLVYPPTGVRTNKLLYGLWELGLRRSHY